MQRTNITGVITGFDGGAQWSEREKDHIKGGGDYEKGRPWCKGGPWYCVMRYQHSWWKYVEKNNGEPMRECLGRRYFYR